MSSARDVACIFVDVDQGSHAFRLFFHLIETSPLRSSIFNRPYWIYFFLSLLTIWNYLRSIWISILFLYIFSRSTNVFSDFHQCSESILRHWSILIFNSHTFINLFWRTILHSQSRILILCIHVIVQTPSQHLAKLSIQLSLTWRIIRSSICSFIYRRVCLPIFRSIANFDSLLFYLRRANTTWHLGKVSSNFLRYDQRSYPSIYSLVFTNLSLDLESRFSFYTFYLLGSIRSSIYFHIFIRNTCEIILNSDYLYHQCILVSC